MKNIIMTGNTHFDPVWLWRWDEALSSITSTFRSVLARMKEYDDFTYSFSAPAVLEWIEKTDKELFEEIKKYIDEDRWELCEGWWLQADCNTALGESYVRQGLYAQKYFEKKFNKRSKTVFNIDSFGHPATLPQILSGLGIENYMFWRPNEEHKSLKTPLFNWVGENGASIKTYRIGGDGGEIFTVDITEETLNPLIDNADNIPHDLMVVYGVTDHGGAPTVKMINKIKEKAEEVKDKYNLKFGRVDEFFDNVDMSSLPVVKDELQVKFIGPYSNFTEIKKNNRKSEYSVMNAEKVSVILANILNEEYPKDTIDNCWKDIMFNQFHDILGGCCIEASYFDARNLHGRAIQSSSEIIHFGLQKITNKIKMPGKNPDNAWNLVVWNLNGFEINTEIEAEVQWAWEFDWYNDGIVLVDENGEETECQIIDELPVVPKFRSRFVFKANLPAFGYRSYIVKQTHKPVKKVIENKAENQSFKICYDDNGIISLFDKKKGKNIINSLMRPYVVYDICDTWGFNKTVYESEKHFLKLSSFDIVENGIVRTTARLMWEFNKSSVEQYITLYDDHIGIKYRALWSEEGAALKLMFSTGEKINTKVSVPYGCIEREECEYERPMGEWINAYNDNTDITVSADSIFAYNFDGENIGFTVLRNAIFGDLRTEPLDTERFYRYMGQGIFEGCMDISFDSDSDKEGILLNNPPIILCEANHDGEYSSFGQFFNCSNNNIVLTTMKKAEDDDSFILRLYNPKETKENTDITLFDKTYSISLEPHDIKTVSVNKENIKTVNFLEE